MNFWTAARCKTISTELLLDNLTEILAQARNTKNIKTRDSKLRIAALITSELGIRDI